MQVRSKNFSVFAVKVCLIANPCFSMIGTVKGKITVSEFSGALPGHDLQVQLIFFF